MLEVHEYIDLLKIIENLHELTLIFYEDKMDDYLQNLHLSILLLDLGYWNLSYDHSLSLDHIFDKLLHNLIKHDQEYKGFLDKLIEEHQLNDGEYVQLLLPYVRKDP